LAPGSSVFFLGTTIFSSSPRAASHLTAYVLRSIMCQ
jgi:hypothetical protein